MRDALGDALPHALGNALGNASGDALGKRGVLNAGCFLTMAEVAYCETDA